MKKFFICFLILLVFSGFLFFVGWAQRKIDSDSYGIVVSKTKGIDENLIIPGKITFVKEFLIPTNAEIKEFKIEPVTVTTTINGQLPSGDLYTSIYNSSNNFSYHFDFTISVTLPPESLLELYKLNRISDNESLQKYMTTAAQTMAQLSADYILRRISENPSFRIESLRRDEITKNVKLYQDYPEIELFGFAITESKVPDFNLYKQLQNQFIQNQDRYFITESSKNNASNIETPKNETVISETELAE